MLLEALFRGVDANDGTAAHSKYEGTRLVPLNDSDYDAVREMQLQQACLNLILD